MRQSDQTLVPPVGLGAVQIKIYLSSSFFVFVHHQLLFQSLFDQPWEVNVELWVATVAHWVAIAGQGVFELDEVREPVAADGVHPLHEEPEGA